MTLFRFRALVTVGPPARPVRGLPPSGYPNGTRSLMVHASHLGPLSCDKYFQAMLTWDGEDELRPGERSVVTITVTDQEAPAYLAAGQDFTLFGGGSGSGVITRRVFSTGSPS